MATAGKQDKLNIQIKSIKTAMSTMFTQIHDTYRSNVLNNDNRRNVFVFWSFEKKIPDFTEGNEIEQSYDESTNF